MESPFLVFFDLDGTLVDTEPLAARAIVEAYEGWFGPGRITLAEAEYTVGRTWANALDHIFTRIPPPGPRQEAFSQILKTYRNLLTQAQGAELEVPGAIAAVQAFSQTPGVGLGLVSGSHRDDIFWNLKRLGIVDHFEVILGAEDYGASKPSPEGYLKAVDFFMQKHGITARPPVLIFEDSEAGIRSAIAAKAEVFSVRKQPSPLPVRWTFPDLRVVTPEWIKQTISDLQSVFV